MRLACKVKALAKEAKQNVEDVYMTPNKNCPYTLAYDGTCDNNLRYVGNSPCHYIKVDDGTGNKETRLKIMRRE